MRDEIRSITFGIQVKNQMHRWTVSNRFPDSDYKDYFQINSMTMALYSFFIPPYFFKKPKNLHKDEKTSSHIHEKTSSHYP